MLQQLKQTFEIFSIGSSVTKPELKEQEPFEEFFQPSKLIDIYNKYPTGAGGRMYSFGETGYSGPLNIESLKTSPINEYWDLITKNYFGIPVQEKEKILIGYIERIKNQGITTEELGKLIAKELPTRVTAFFTSACEIQAQMDIEMVQGIDNSETKEERIKERNRNARIPEYLKGFYQGNSTSKYGWGIEGNRRYKEVIEEEIQKESRNTPVNELKIKHLKELQDKWHDSLFKRD